MASTRDSETTDTAWADAPERPAIALDEVHVWRANLAIPSDQLMALAATLSVDERERARRYYFEHDRNRFVAARGILRALLARYLDEAAAALQFDYQCRCGRPDCRHERRKPALAADAHDGRLRFNLSHTGDLAVYAVAQGREVGVDVERIEMRLGFMDLAERIFAADENDALRAVDPDRQCAAFYAGWTRKEAYSKATGMGLSLEPDQVNVTIRPDDPPALLAVPGGEAERQRWSLHHLEPGPDLAGALVVEGHDLTLRCWQWR